MKQCSVCKTQAPDETKYCANCGTRFDGEKKYDLSSLIEENEKALRQAEFENPEVFETVQRPAVQQPVQQLPEKWFHFLIYFALWAGALMNIITAVQYLTGSVYSRWGVTADFAYRSFEGLQALDIFYGLVLLGLAVFRIYTRFRLAGYKMGAPFLLYVMYGSEAVAVLMYELLYSDITEKIMDHSVWGSLLISVVMIVLNYFYFKKRAHYFEY